MEDVQMAMNLTRLEPYASAELLNARLAVEGNRPLVGIIFDESFSPSTSQVPKHLNYKLRFPGELRVVPTFQSGSSLLYNNWRTQFLYPPFAEGGPRNRHRDTGGRPPGYYDEKFSSVQSAVSLAFIKLHGGGEESLPEIKLQRFSYPPATVDILLEVLKVFVALMFFLSFLYPCINNVKVNYVACRVMTHYLSWPFIASSKSALHLFNGGKFNPSPSDDHGGEGASTEGVNEDHGTPQLVALDRVVRQDYDVHGHLNHNYGGAVEDQIFRRQ